MIRSERLHQVRLVEDRDGAGTVVTDNVSGSDSRTIFPLQAALGYTIAQNLFISKYNLLVEGPADLVYLRFFSAALEAVRRQDLREDITLMPAGGLDKVATFIALLGANDLKIVVLHDYVGRPDQRLESLVAERMIRERQVLHYGLFRNPVPRTKSAPKVPSTPPPPADVEDLLSLSLYLGLFNATFVKQLGGVEITEADLPPGDRIVDRLTRYTLADGEPASTISHFGACGDRRQRMDRPGVLP